MQIEYKHGVDIKTFGLLQDNKQELEGEEE